MDIYLRTKGFIFREDDGGGRCWLVKEFLAILVIYGWFCCNKWAQLRSLAK